MRVPIIELQSLYHVGNLTLKGASAEERLWTKTWDFEIGLCSVSLDPAYWVARSNPNDIFEIRNSAPFRLVDADLLITRHRAAVLREAATKGWISKGSLTPAAYCELNLTENSFCSQDVPMQLEATCAILLALRDQTIDGFWWSNVTSGIASTPRGGLFQDRLPTYVTKKLASSPAAASPPKPHWKCVSVLKNLT